MQDGRLTVLSAGSHAPSTTHLNAHVTLVAPQAAPTQATKTEFGGRWRPSRARAWLGSLSARFVAAGRATGGAAGRAAGGSAVAAGGALWLSRGWLTAQVLPAQPGDEGAHSGSRSAAQLDAVLQLGAVASGHWPGLRVPIAAQCIAGGAEGAEGSAHACVALRARSSAQDVTGDYALCPCAGGSAQVRE